MYNYIKILILSSLVNISTCSFIYAQNKSGGGMPPTVVETAHPNIQALSKTLSAVGTLRASEAITVRPEAEGKIENIFFKEGEKVEKGTLLFRLDTSLARSALLEAEAMAANSARELKRAEELHARKLISPSDHDMKRAQAKIDEARLSSSKTRLSKTEIRAPFGGIIGLRKVSVGEYVKAGDALVDLVELDPVKLDFSLPEIDSGKIQPGQKLTITLDAYPGETFEGKVYAVAPEVEAASRSIPLRAMLSNFELKFKPGMFARVKLEISHQDQTLLIPEQALWPQGDKQFVYLIKEGKAELVPVTIGQRLPGQVQVLSGLTPDSEVIIAGQMKIGPGSPVMKAETTPAG